MQENINNVENAAAEVELSEILQIRRDKLANLCAAGNNPFEKVKYDVDAYTTDIVEKFDEYEGKTVAVIHNTTTDAVTIDLSKYPQIPADLLAGFAGIGEATLEGNTLTLDGQTSVILR